MRGDAVQPLTKEECSTFIQLALLEKKDPDSFLKLFDEIKKDSFIIKVLIKRIEVFKLPKFEASGLIVLEMFSQGNPGRAVLSLIDTMEAYDELKPDKIDMDFICTHVYPWGIYSTGSFEKEWDSRKKDMSKGYNILIVNK